MQTFNPTLRKKRQADLCELEASLVYTGSSRTDAIAAEKPCPPKQTNKHTNTKRKKHMEKLR